MDMEGVEEQDQGEEDKGEKEKLDSTFIRDMGLEGKQEMELNRNCSFQDPD